MIKEIRQKYNSDFTPEAYHNFINSVWSKNNNKIDFRLCETPFFFDDNLKDKLIDSCNNIIDQLKTESFQKYALNAVPEEFKIANEDSHPIFLQIDFGICKDENGELVPKLIELQGFPSLYAFQAYLDIEIRNHFKIDDRLKTFFNNYNFTSYIDLLKKTILGSSSRENVILLELEPHNQKTRIDFYLTKEYIGIEPVCITEIIQEGNSLFYIKDQKKIRIERIYNRVIFDELERKNINIPFDYKSNLNVYWVGHPNWFFKISKHTLPFLKGESVPNCYFLSEVNLDDIDLSKYVLKPLYSFAGAGVKVDLTEDDLTSIENKQNYLLQEKVEYAEIIDTPTGFSKAEVRMMFIWNDEPILVNNLVRTSKGKMIGVDFNKDKDWIGASIGYHF
ncbi:MAG: hypothetical protein K8F60_03485 [Melioribacteraceae bacterium]|nr:hypothetical protein [Melioribacteraceae bacterium]